MLTDGKRLRIVAIGAHPDDIELACGGTVAKARLQGHMVKMIVVTGKSSRDHQGQSIRSDLEAERETLDAASRLGVEDVDTLGYPDMQVPYSAELVTQLDEIITDYNADIIFTHFPFDTHQDHIRTAQASVAAVRRFNTVLLYEPITPSGRGYVAFRPQVYVDISGTVDAKLTALEAHKSQLRKYGDRWLAAVEARCKYRGFEMNADYAECFEAVRLELLL